MAKILISTCMFIFLLMVEVSVAQDQKKEGAHPSFGANTIAGKYLATRGIKIYYESYGQGTPVLLIHGNGGSVSSMANQIPFFAGNYQVIAADSRSQGRTFDPRDSLSYEMMADDLNALLDTLKLKHVNIIGWSDGGIIGLLMAIRHPEKVGKLAITGANIRPDSSAVAAADIRSMTEHVAQLKTQPENIQARHEIKLTELMIREPNISHSQLQQIHCPVLVIAGDHDIIKLGHTIEIFENITDSRLWILPGSGHDTCIKFADDFNRQVGRFFGETKK